MHTKEMILYQPPIYAPHAVVVRGAVAGVVAPSCVAVTIGYVVVV
jgi:hypothetical protein